MLERILAGDLRALARAATAIENDTAVAHQLLPALAAHTGRARILGVTGPPGAGKSTLVDRLTSHYRHDGKTVGIIAVDPSSPVSGGAILGDRVRMQAHHADPGVFIRSMATRGSLGGLARATEGLARLLDAAGRDVVIIETVGVGQAEVDIARIAQVVCVVLVPGMGDDVQALKAGILEIADLFVVNKADYPGADRLERELHAFSGKPIFKTVASEGSGVAELVEAIERIPGRPRRHHSGATAAAALDHLGIAVRSIEAALGFYRDQLGLRAVHREIVEQEKVHIAMLPVGDSRIELLEPSAPDSPIAKFLDKRGEGLHHVAVRVADFDGALERLRAAGARLLSEPRAGAGGHIYVFIHPASTGGVLLEIIKDHNAS